MYNKLVHKETRLALVGLGYVGLPIALEFAKKISVIGFDINEERLTMMRQGIDPCKELDSEAFENADILFITDGEDSISDELASELQEAIQGARCSVVGLLLDADSPGMEFALDKFCERIYRISEMHDKDDILTNL